MGHGRNQTGNGLCTARNYRHPDPDQVPIQHQCINPANRDEVLIRHGKEGPVDSDILEQRDYLRKELSRFPMVKQILPSDANFLMARFDNPQEVFAYLAGKKIVVRDRSKVILCEGYLRITVGSADENKQLIKALQLY